MRREDKTKQNRWIHKINEINENAVFKMEEDIYFHELEQNWCDKAFFLQNGERNRDHFSTPTLSLSLSLPLWPSGPLALSEF